MRITCKQSDLKHGLGVVNHSITGRSTLPILANILLVTDQGRLKMAGTNLEIGINCWVDAQIEEEGEITIPAKLLTDFVDSLPQADVQMTVAEGSTTMRVQGQRSSANIKGMEATEFPKIPTSEDGDVAIRLEADQLKDLIARVAFAAADDDSRPVLTGVLVRVNEGRATFAAADAFRLAVGIITLPDDTSIQNDILIPARTLVELERILPNEGSVEMIVTPNRSQVLFQGPNLTLVSRLLEGNFPNFNQIIPKESTTTIILCTKDFAAATKSTALFARDSSNIVRLRANPEGLDGDGEASVTLEATAEDLGDNISTIQAQIEGPEQNIIFNVKYLADVLAAVKTPEIALKLQSTTRPGLLAPVGSGDYTYVIMPMHLNR